MDGEVAEEKGLMKFAGLDRLVFNPKRLLAEVPAILLADFIRYYPNILRLIIP